ncbi:hypothetical protein AVEN_16334-1, partial [Araneus ventricosus]
KDMEKILDGHLFAIFMGTNSIKSRGKHPEGPKLARAVGLLEEQLQKTPTTR